MLNKIREDAESLPMKVQYKLENGLCTIEDQEEIIALNDPYFAYRFARYVSGADIEKCQEAACKDPCWAYWFALNIPGANKEKIRQVLIGTEYEGEV